MHFFRYDMLFSIYKSLFKKLSVIKSIHILIFPKLHLFRTYSKHATTKGQRPQTSVCTVQCHSRRWEEPLGLIS